MRSDAMSRHSGGVILFYRTDLNVVKLADHVQGYNNILIVDVLSNDCRGIWVGVYHSPGSSDAEFLNEFETVIEPLVSQPKPVTVTGDFNINVHRSAQFNTYRQRLSRFEHSHSMKQLITDFTRVTAISRTTVDLVFTNNHMISAAVSNNNIIADHKMLIICKTTVHRDYHRKRIIDRSRLVAANYEPILSAKMNDCMLSNDINLKAAQITEAIETSAASLVAEKMVNISYGKRWYNDELSRLRRERNEAEKRAEITNLEQNWADYRMKRNLYSRELKKSKNSDLLSILRTCEGDQKKLWRHLKTFMDNREAPPSCIIINDQKLIDKKMIADKLNEYFISSISIIKSSIPAVGSVSSIPTSGIVPWRIFEYVNEAQVNRVIANFKSKSGVNNVNKDVMKLVMHVCSESIVDIINDSLESGIFPNTWKYTIVTPIPKVKGTNKPDELRPINNCNCIDKIIQTFVKQQLEDHIRENNILFECQSAYREKHSCETAINFVLAGWIQNRESKMKIVAVFIDLSRAFETVDRQILIEILKMYGIDGTVLEWFKSWLTNRRQYTKFDETISDPIEINDGIPQGTPLSSILFILYINLIVRCLKFCKIKLFADDCLIWIAENDVAEAIRKIMIDLENISFLLKQLKLKLNSLKSKYMIIGDHNLTSEYHLVIDDQEIERVQKMKYLGVIIDDRLSFKDHCEYITKKMSKKVNFLRRIRNRLDLDTALMLFKSLITPHVDFCSSILFLLNDNEIRSIQLIQNRAMRIILNCARETSIRSMLQRTSLLTIRQQINYNVILLMFKATHNLLPSYISSQFVYVSDVQPYPLRSNELLRLPQLFSHTGQKSLIYRGAQIYNEMVQNGIETNVLMKDFKITLRQYVIEKF